MRALGIDVSVRRGLDAVLLDEDRRVLDVASRLRVEEVPELARRLRPDVICVDSPAAWARSGRSRPAERALARMGITAYATPMDPGDHPFYAWMAAGFSVYAALADEYPLLREGGVFGRAAEVFPHASAVLLAGRLPAGEAKLAFRTSVLRDHGVDTSALETQDRVDAALGALTGVRALSGDYCAIGEAEDGLLLLPVRALPDRVRRHGLAPAGEQPAAPQRSIVATDCRDGESPVVVPLPGECHCGCGEATGARARFRPGHDGRYKGRLLRAERRGDLAARRELERLDWLR